MCNGYLCVVLLACLLTLILNMFNERPQPVSLLVVLYCYNECCFCFTFVCSVSLLVYPVCCTVCITVWIV